MKLRNVTGFAALAVLLGCASSSPRTLVVPSIEYANKIKRAHGLPLSSELESTHAQQAAITGGMPLGYKSAGNFASPAVQHADYAAGQNRARYQFVSDSLEEAPGAKAAVVTNMHDAPALADAQDQSGTFQEQRSSLSPDKRDYNGPLSLGDPGVSASLWHESRGGNELFRDDRAWQPMDLITIVVSESSEGSKQADTEVKEKSSISAAIENLLGFEADVKAANKDVALDSLLKAETTNDFKGEGETTRKDSLKARISAMVAEVLPSGIIRIEGERIISVNSEEQVMVISGLVRPRDINSANEVDSSKIANLRIDYYGRGTVGEAQNAGWLGRIIRHVWPF